MVKLNMLVAGAVVAVLLNLVASYAAQLALDNKALLDSAGLGVLSDNPVSDMLRMHHRRLLWTSVLVALIGGAVVFFQPPVNVFLKENVVNVDKALM